MMGSAVRAPMVQKETLWIGMFRSYMMRKKEPELGLERWVDFGYENWVEHIPNR